MGTRDLNKVQLTGRLGFDPEGRYTTDGSSVCNLRVASNRTWKDSSGGKHEEAEWFRVSAWNKLGEVCNTYLAKGTHVYIEGRLQTRKYTDRDGVERYSTEVVASDMIILSSKGERSAGPDVGDEDDPGLFEEPAPPLTPLPGLPQPPAPGRTPARAGARTSAPNAPRPPARNQPQPISADDDIPF